VHNTQDTKNTKAFFSKGKCCFGALAF
jgi:hypothetical protein